ncbi:hypothetical protein [Lacrimispora sp. 38-1]
MISNLRKEMTARETEKWYAYPDAVILAIRQALYSSRVQLVR